MGVIQSFERRLQGAVGNTFARLFGGSVHPAEVMAALQEEAGSHLREQSGRRIAPNSFAVELGNSDRQSLGQDESSVASALTDSVREYLAEQGWETFGDVAVRIEASDRLHTGQFHVTSVIDPDIVVRAGRLVVPHENTPAHPDVRQAQPGVGTMTQDPNRPYYPPQPGQQGGQPYHPQQPPQQPYYPQQQPGYPQAQPQYDPQWGAQPGYAPPPVQPQYDPNAYPPQYDPNQYQPVAPAPPQYDPNQYDPNAYQQPYDEYAQYPSQPAQDLVGVLHLDDGSGRNHQLARGSNVVGRGQDAHFRLPDTSVSRRHVDIYFDGQVAVMHDLGSTNGSAVNGSNVQTWQLADGDVIRIGHSSLIFNLHG